MQSYVADTSFFSLIGMVLLGYMFLGCILSLFIVYKELMLSVSIYTNEEDVIEHLKCNYPDLREKTEKKVKIWVKKQKKMSSVFIYPNFFQIISSVL